MNEFSGKTTHLWGVLRPDGKAVMEQPTSRSDWRTDTSLDIAGFTASGANPDDWGNNGARRVASILTDELIERGVAEEAAEHRVVLFTITTSVTATEASA